MSEFLEILKWSDQVGFGQMGRKRNRGEIHKNLKMYLIPQRSILPHGLGMTKIKHPLAVHFRTVSKNVTSPLKIIPCTNIH